MIHLKRGKEFKKILPTISILFAPQDKAIAQSTQQPQQLPQPTSIDSVSMLGYAILGITALWGVGSQLITKAGGMAIASKEKKINQELSQDAAINDGYVRQADKSFEALIALLNTAIGNILQTSRESKEIFYLGHEETRKNTEAIEKLEITIEKNSDDIAKILGYQKDIMNVLKMRMRGDHEPS
jgi:hypothetical protein